MPRPIRSVAALIQRHEGLRLKPYRDTVGKLTIGVGRNLDDVGISREEARKLLERDIEGARTAARRYTWFEDLNGARQAVIIDMIFNLGRAGFRGFRRTRAAVAAGDYETAAAEMLDSGWATQVGERARRLARMIRTGKWPTT